mgnify:CR=1 FL=1
MSQTGESKPSLPELKSMYLREVEMICTDILAEIKRTEPTQAMGHIQEFLGGVIDAAMEFMSMDKKGLRITGSDWLPISKFLSLVMNNREASQLLQKVIHRMDRKGASAILLTVASIDAVQCGADINDIKAAMSRAFLNVQHGHRTKPEA